MNIQEIKASTLQDNKLRVCAYCRVSSDHEEQINSIENQKKYYAEYLGKDDRYEYVGLYYDIGISGKVRRRPQFQKMLADGRAGKYDMIVTKSISRFARDTETMLMAVRELKSLDIGVFFELQNMNTLNMDGELLLTIYAALAQAESDTTSELLTMSHQRRASKGNHNTCFTNTFGYSVTEDGVIYADKDAAWVKVMFEMAASGYKVAEIKRFLNNTGVKSKTGKAFSGTTVGKILRNIIYTGTILRPHYYKGADGMAHINDGTHAPLRDENHHEAIISFELYENANQRLGFQEKKAVSIDELKQEMKKYKGLLYCSRCGHLMYPVQDKRTGIGYFVCYGKAKNYKSFCDSVGVPFEEVKKMGRLDGKVYIDMKTDDLGRWSYPFEPEAVWSSHSTKKKPPKTAPDAETKPLDGQFFCEYCSGPIGRYSRAHKKIHWICKNRRKGLCKGVDVPDEVIKDKRPFDGYFYIKEVCINGKKDYSFRRKEGCP